MLRLASSLSRNERSSKLVDPVETMNSSTIITLQWYIVGWYSWISAPAASSSPQRAREAARTVSVSMCSPGVMICSFTPRFIASTIVWTASSLGTKYELERRIVRFAAVIDIRYISSMLALPPLGELLNTWAAPLPTGSSVGK